MGCKIKVMIEKIFVFKKINKAARKRYMILKSERERKREREKEISYITVERVFKNQA